jgi:hypothetical protein
MKKIILGIVFVFATVSLVNANVSKVDKANSIISAENVGANCFQDAWDYGIANGGGSDYWTWYYTDKYYSEHCV